MSTSTPDRSRQINLRVTPDEKERLERRARESGMSVQKYLRYRALSDTPVAFVAKDDLDHQLAGLSSAIDQARRVLRGDK